MSGFEELLRFLRLAGPRDTTCRLGVDNDTIPDEGFHAVPAVQGRVGAAAIGALATQMNGVLHERCFQNDFYTGSRRLRAVGT